MFAEIIFEHSMPIWLIVAGLSIAVVTGLFSVWRFLPFQWTNIVLFILRVAFLLVLGWCLLLPMMRKSLSETVKPRFVVALDSSASMVLSPSSKKVPTNRWYTAQNVITQAWTKRIQGECHFELFPFDADSRPAVSLQDALALEPNGQSTHLRESLRKILNRYRGQNLVGLLLLSDGLDTREVHDDWAKENWPCPIYTVRLEPPDVWEMETDVRVDSIDTSRRVVVGWETKLTATVSGQGAKGQVLNVQLFKDGLFQEEVPTQLPAEGGSREVSFHLTHPDVGTFVYSVAIPPLPKETRTNDNAFAVSVQVVDARNRVLYVEGVPRWESKYMVRALKGNKNITPLCFMRGPNKKFLTFGERGAMTLDMTDEQLSLYKIVIIGDLEADVLGEQRAAALLKFVENGGSLVLLGGPNAWGGKGFASTGLKKCLPFQRPWESPAEEGSFPVTLTDEGRTHAVFTAGTNSWAKLPPILSILGGATLSPGAVALVEAKTPQGTQPVLITQKYGQGKVAVVLTDSLWRWQLNPGEDRAYGRFWTQMMEWLSPAETELAKYELDLFADVDQLFLGESIALKARITGAENKPPPPKAEVVCEIQTPTDRRIPLTMAKQMVTVGTGKSYDGFGVEFSPQAPQTPGLYKAVATVEIEGKKIESAPYSFFIKGFTPETNPKPANVELLKALAETSKGRFLEPNEVDAVLTNLKIKTSEEQRVEFSSLWHTILVISCLMALLTIEWSIRKAKNLA